MIDVWAPAMYRRRMEKILGLVLLVLAVGCGGAVTDEGEAGFGGVGGAGGESGSNQPFDENATCYSSSSLSLYFYAIEGGPKMGRLAPNESICWDHALCVYYGSAETSADNFLPGDARGDYRNSDKCAPSAPSAP